MTKKPNKNPAFMMLMLDLITVVLICECLLELQEEKLFITLVGASADQLNQNLWVRAQTLVNFEKIVVLTLTIQPLHCENECPWEGQIDCILLLELNHLIGPFKSFNLDIMDNVTEEIPSQCLVFTNCHITFV